MESCTAMHHIITTAVKLVLERYECKEQCHIMASVHYNSSSSSNKSSGISSSKAKKDILFLFLLPLLCSFSSSLRGKIS